MDQHIVSFDWTAESVPATPTHLAAPAPAAQEMKVPTLPPLSPTQWAALDGKAKWDSQVALRGPDLRGSGLAKWFTTGVIRHRLSEVMRVGGLVNSTLPFVVIPKNVNQDPGKVKKNPLQFDLAHWVTHVYEAANWLSIPIAWIDRDLWIDAIMVQRTPEALELIAQAIGEPRGSILRPLLHGGLQ